MRLPVAGHSTGSCPFFDVIDFDASFDAASVSLDSEKRLGRLKASRGCCSKDMRWAALIVSTGDCFTASTPLTESALGAFSSDDDGSCGAGFCSSAELQDMVKAVMTIVTIERMEPVLVVSRSY
jgi:hypothetical protein